MKGIKCVKCGDAFNRYSWLSLQKTCPSCLGSRLTTQRTNGTKPKWKGDKSKKKRKKMRRLRLSNNKKWPQYLNSLSDEERKREIWMIPQEREALKNKICEGGLS